MLATVIRPAAPVRLRRPARCWRCLAFRAEQFRRRTSAAGPRAGAEGGQGRLWSTAIALGRFAPAGSSTAVQQPGATPLAYISQAAATHAQRASR